jgi:hypothetical protein
VNVFPEVTACVAESAPVARRREFVLSVTAHQPAVCVAVTEPSVIAVVVTLRPFGDPAAGAPTAAPAPKFLLPHALVLVASVKVVGYEVKQM